MKLAELKRVTVGDLFWDGRMHRRGIHNRVKPPNASYYHALVRPPPPQVDELTQFHFWSLGNQSFFSASWLAFSDWFEELQWVYHDDT